MHMEMMPAMYSAIEAVADGRVAEVEVEHRVVHETGYEEVVAVTVHRDPKPGLTVQQINAVLDEQFPEG